MSFRFGLCLKLVHELGKSKSRFIFKVESYFLPSSLEEAIANDIHQIQIDLTSAPAVEEDSGKENGMNHGAKRRESVATSGYLSADEDGKITRCTNKLLLSLSRWTACSIIGKKRGKGSNKLAEN